MPTHEKTSFYDAPPSDLFAWHLRPGAFERLGPPWQDLRIIERTGTVRDGDTVELEIKVGPVPVRWKARHEGFEEGRQFCDVQERGPFAEWTHTHRFEPSDGGCLMIDRVEYRLPSAGAVLFGRKVRDNLERLFAFRHERLRRDLQRHRVYSKHPMRVAVAGASGLVGTALSAFLSTGGHEVVRLVRNEPAGKDEIRWNPSAGRLDPASMEEFDAVICLSGVNIAEGRWTEKRRDSILESRKGTAGLLSRTMAELEQPPRVFLCASAVGYYDLESTGPQTEEDGKGDGFLADVCEEWEAACRPARNAGIRVVNMRFGPVLTPAGGVLAKTLPVFRMGLGGVLGSGEQGFSWIGLDDLLGAVLLLMTREDVEGPVNVTAPNPVTNAEFTHTLGHVLRRPALFWVPSTIVRGAFGDMGEEMLLKGSFVHPERLIDAGFTFLEPDLEGALRWEMGIPKEHEMS